MSSTQEQPRAAVGVIGGTGLYSFLTDAIEVRVETPYGAPSAPLTIGEVGGVQVAFLPRHGRGHEFPPHAIPYRANLWALRSLGVRQVLAPCAVGGLRAEVAPGDLVAPDQLVDRTWRRIPSYVETGATHVPLADPYCGRLSAAYVSAAGSQVTSGGTLAVIEGPRFSTRAESRYHAAQGWTLVGMTGAPEAALARELLMCYAPLCLVTDMDAGAEEGEGVDEEDVLALFAANLDRMRDILFRTIGSLPDADGCACSAWAKGKRLAYDVPGDPR